MAQKKERTCIQCGTVELTFSRAERCDSCFSENKREKTKLDNIKELIGFGYQDVRFVEANAFGHWVFSVLNPECGHRCQMKMGNFRKQFVIFGKMCCPTCGKKERASKALAGYLENNARDYDLELYEDYRKKVNGLSNQMLAKFPNLINPDGYKRGRFHYHLDHIKPVIVCFKEGLSVEEAAAVSNLQMLPWQQNLSKGSKHET